MAPYASHVTGKDPLDVLRSTLDGYRQLFSRYTDADWASSWAPGKWTAHQVMVHVTQWELIFGARIRTALAMPGYAVQPMEQDDILKIEAPAVDTRTAADAFESMRRMNIALVGALTPAQRATTITHPERGVIDIEDLIVTLAGHGAHHLSQLRPD